MRVIFLDIDGVLNYRPGYRLEQEPVQNLNRLVEVLDAKVVVHSSWTYLFSLEQIKDKLKAYGVATEHLIDVAPAPASSVKMSGIILLDDSLSQWAEETGIPVQCDRAVRIAMWLKDNPDVTEYVILDDFKDFDRLKSRHVLTVMGEGLGFNEEKLREAERLFTF